MSNTPTPQDEVRKILKRPVDIHFKENSIPGLRRGEMTNDCIDVILGLFQSQQRALIERIEAAMPAKQYNDLFELKKLTAWRRAKARSQVKAHNAIIDQVTAALNAEKERL